MLISPTRAKILLNFAHADEASKANFHENKRIIYRPPFMKKVYDSRSYIRYLRVVKESLKKNHY